MFCYLKLRRVMSVFASPVVSSDRSVMILIFLESVESQFVSTVYAGETMSRTRCLEVLEDS